MSTLDDPTPISLDLDPAVRPQDDLFGHVNGRWLASVEIPEDRATYGSFEILRDLSEEQVKTIIAEAAERDAADGSVAQKIGDLYASFMDTDSVEAAGIEPLAPLFERVRGVTTVDELVLLMGQLAIEGIGGVLSVGTWVDRGNPDRYLLHISQSGLGLPDESYYSAEEHADIREAYLPHMATMLHLTGAAPTEAHATTMSQRIMGLETQIAEAHWERTALRDAVKTYNLTEAGDLRTLLPVADTWLSEGMGLEPRLWAETVVGQPDVVEAMAALLTAEPVEVWQEWLLWRVIRSMAGYLTDEIVQTSFEFYGKRLTGAPALRPRWKRGVGLVEGLVGELVGQLYVERHYPPAAEQQMAVLIDNLIAAYRVRITDLGWMQAETRERALAKLEAFTPKIGKPVRWKDYDALVIDAADLLGNVRRSNAVETERALAKLDGPVDRDEWFMSPQTVNAYYNPAMNEIVFPAAILQAPFFDPDRDAAYDYGGIGAVIGHEIGHGFDDQGSRYDGDGTLRNWWTDADREAFDAKVTALIEEFDTYSPRDLGDSHLVKGALTVGENIGDLGGIAVAHHAYRLYCEATYEGGEPPVLDGLTGDQRFFLGWAMCWRVAAREEEAIRRLTVDPHSPAEFRANAVRNVDAFHEAFGVTEDDGLWVAPEDRVSIW